MSEPKEIKTVGALIRELRKHPPRKPVRMMAMTWSGCDTCGSDETERTLHVVDLETRIVIERHESAQAEASER